VTESADDFDDMLAEFRAADLADPTTTITTTTTTTKTSSSSSIFSDSSSSSSNNNSAHTTARSDVTEDMIVDACERSDIALL
jgi:hypothetical protein